MHSLKATAKRSKWAVIAATLAKNQRARWAAARGTVASTSGSTHAPLELSESVAYINAVFDDYLTYGQLDARVLRGARVLELGPGDNYGVALRFLGAGAEHVVAVDRFASRRDPDQQRRIYEHLLTSLPPEQRRAIEDAVELSDGVRFDGRRLNAIEGIAVEEISEALAGETFDLVVSRAVLEHLYDLDAAFDSMDQLLAPGGMMLHKVDLRDHGMFTDGGMHPLTFLTIPERTYTWMTRDSGRPNRHLADWYRAKLESLGYESQVLVTHLAGADGEVIPHREAAQLAPQLNGARALVASIRPRLQPRFRRLDEADLATSGIFLVTHKPV